MSSTHDGAFRLSVAKVNSSVYTLLGIGAVAFAYSAYIGNVLIGLVVAAGCAAAAWWWRRRTVSDRGIKLTVNGDGIHSPDTTEKPVPWNVLSKIILSSTAAQRRSAGSGMAGMIVLDIKGDPRQFGPKEGKYFGGSSLTINVDELDGTAQDIRNLITQLAPGLEVLEK